MLTTFAAKAQQELDIQITDIEIWLTSGKAKDYSDYRFMVGQLSGLKTAKTLVGELLRAAQNSED
jgi:hypothetical protein